MPEHKVFTVSEITRTVRNILEREIGEVWVEGEISNLRKQASGHQYFTLKDTEAQLSCVLFRGSARQLGRLNLEDGQQVQVSGEITVYEARGQYQLICRLVQPKGLGALQAKFEALKNKLQSEGLFDPSLKKPIPRFPRTLAVVTSPTGAAIRDMLNILARRAPWVRILIYPVRVQGKGAEKEIASAIADLNRASGRQLPRIDVMVVGRGGGSIEDLWNFNEEIVARAIRDSKIPIVSAVGHEIDFTIADFAADLRAPTPSAAAELIVPDQADLKERLRKLENAMLQDVLGALEHHRRVLELLERGALAREPRRALGEFGQELDYLGEALRNRSRAIVDRLQRQAANAARILALSRPDRALRQRQEQFVLLQHQLTSAALHQLRQREEHCKSLASLVRTLGPEATFARGFSLTTDEHGNTLTDASQVQAGQTIRSRLAEGKIESVVK